MRLLYAAEVGLGIIVAKSQLSKNKQKNFKNISNSDIIIYEQYIFGRTTNFI